MNFPCFWTNAFSLPGIATVATILNVLVVMRCWAENQTLNLTNSELMRYMLHHNSAYKCHKEFVVRASYSNLFDNYITNTERILYLTIDLYI